MNTEISVNVRRAYIETNLEQCKRNIALSVSRCRLYEMEG